MLVKLLIDEGKSGLDKYQERSLFELSVKIDKILIEAKKLENDYAFGIRSCEKCIPQLRATIHKGNYAFDVKIHKLFYSKCDKCNRTFYVIYEKSNESLLETLRGTNEKKFTDPEQVGLNRYTIGGLRFEH